MFNSHGVSMAVRAAVPISFQRHGGPSFLSGKGAGKGSGSGVKTAQQAAKERAAKRARLANEGA